MTRPSLKPIAIIDPACERFIDFIVKGAVEQWVKEHAERSPGDERIGDVVPKRSPSKRQASTHDYETITLDEAVARYGLSRAEIMADFERNMVPFVVELQATRPRHGGTRPTRPARPPGIEPRATQDRRRRSPQP